MTYTAVFLALLLQQAPAGPQQAPSGPQQVPSGSLYSDTAPSLYLFRDFKARNVNDILTIQITETSTATNSANTSTKKEGSVSVTAPALAGLEKGASALNFANILAGTSALNFAGTGSTSCTAGLALCLVFVSSASAASRIKDIGHFAGVRSNALSGYGLVIGLNKTGDKRQTFFTQQTLLNMLERFGLTINNPSVRVENIAAVMVTTDLGAFEKPGSRIDVTVSSIGDATSLQGGILLQTPLIAADGNVYAVAQGPLVLSGYSAGNAATGVTVNHPTVGRIPNGASVERVVVAGKPPIIDKLELFLYLAEFTTLKKGSEALNNPICPGNASPLSSPS